MPEGVRRNVNSKYSVSLYELLKSYSNHVMKKNFLSINIPKLPLCSTEQAIEVIKKNLQNLKDWKEVSEFIPQKFRKTTKLKRTGIAGFLAASLELSKEGLIKIMQKRDFDKLLIKEKK